MEEFHEMGLHSQLDAFPNKLGFPRRLVIINGLHQIGLGYR